LFADTAETQISRKRAEPADTTTTKQQPLWGAEFAEFAEFAEWADSRKAEVLHYP
jgi:hypothetical protein